MGCFESTERHGSQAASDRFRPLPGSKLTPLYINEVMNRDCHYFYSPDGILKRDPTPLDPRTEIFMETDEFYEKLSSYISAYVKADLLTECELVEEWLPEASPKIDVLTSKDWSTNRNTALIIIPGSGKVTLGQWSRGLCKDIGLRFGTMKSYIDFAHSANFSLLIMNCNVHTQETPNNRSNALLAWRTFVPRCPAERIYIVAHSYGGICCVFLACKELGEFEKRVRKIALTDSVHCHDFPFCMDVPPAVKDVVQRKAVNWVASTEPLDKLISPAGESAHTCEVRSAGHPVHEYTSETAKDAIFAFFLDSPLVS